MRKLSSQSMSEIISHLKREDDVDANGVEVTEALAKSLAESPPMPPTTAMDSRVPNLTFDHGNLHKILLMIIEQRKLRENEVQQIVEEANVLHQRYQGLSHDIKALHAREIAIRSAIRALEDHGITS